MQFRFRYNIFLLQRFRYSFSLGDLMTKTYAIAFHEYIISNVSMSKYPPSIPSVAENNIFINKLFRNNEFVAFLFSPTISFYPYNTLVRVLPLQLHFSSMFFKYNLSHFQFIFFFLCSWNIYASNLKWSSNMMRWEKKRIDTIPSRNIIYRHFFTWFYHWKSFSCSKKKNLE